MNFHGDVGVALSRITQCCGQACQIGCSDALLLHRIASLRIDRHCVSDFGSAAASALAEGRLTCKLVYLLNVVLTIKKIRITSSTSMKAIRLISGAARR